MNSVEPAGTPVYIHKAMEQPVSNFLPNWQVDYFRASLVWPDSTLTERKSLVNCHRALCSGIDLVE